MALGVRPATRVYIHTYTTQYALCWLQQDIHYDQTSRRESSRVAVSLNNRSALEGGEGGCSRRREVGCREWSGRLWALCERKRRSGLGRDRT